jgi:antitoxin HigA-1
MRTRTNPGEVLRVEFMEPASISLDQASRRMGLRIDVVERLLSGAQPVTDVLAGVLSRAFSTSPEFWMNLQRQHDSRETPSS